MRRDRSAFHRTRNGTTLEYVFMALLVATATFAVLAFIAVSAFG